MAEFYTEEIMAAFDSWRGKRYGEGVMHEIAKQAFAAGVHSATPGPASEVYKAETPRRNRSDLHGVRYGSLAMARGAYHANKPEVKVYRMVGVWVDVTDEFAGGKK